MTPAGRAIAGACAPCCIEPAVTSVRCQQTCLDSHLYLGQCAWIEQRLYQRPYGLEHQRCIDDADPAKHLRVVVLVILGHGAHQPLHLSRQVAESNTCTQSIHLDSLRALPPPALGRNQAKSAKRVIAARISAGRQEQGLNSCY